MGVKIKYQQKFKWVNKNVKFVVLALSLSFGLFGCKSAKDVSENKGAANRKQFKTLFHDANAEKMIGHYEKSTALFQECLAIEPNNGAVCFALSDLHEKLGDKTKSLSFAERAYNTDRQNKWYALRLADLYFERARFKESADLYARVIEEEKNVDLKFKYADILIRAQDYLGAIEMLNEIEVETGKIPEVVFTKYDLYIQTNQLTEAENELKAFIADNPGDSDNKIMVAELYMQNQQYGKSEQIINEILSTDSTYGQAYIMRADLALRQDNISAAFSNLALGFAMENVPLERKIELLAGLIPYSGPNQRDADEMKAGVGGLFKIIYDESLQNASLHEYYGYFSAIQADFEMAESQYLIATDLNPASFASWMQLLNASYELEHYSLMNKNGIKAMELFPAQPLFYLLTAISHKEMGELDQAEELFYLGKDLVVKDPELISEFLYQLGDLNLKKNELQIAKDFFKEALLVFPKNVKVYIANAKRLIENDEIEKAQKELEIGLNEVPGQPEMLDLYGVVLIKKKAYVAAIDFLEKALYENIYNGSIMEHFGDAYFLSGQKEKGIELWKEAVKYGNEKDLLKRKIADKEYYEE